MTSEPPPTPPPKTRWWKRAFRRGSARDTSHESDAVKAARIARTVTITTTLITALVGVIGTGATVWVANLNSTEQRRNETEKSAVEFLRKERQEAYSGFGSEVNATLMSIMTASNLVFPSQPPPTPEEFKKGYDDMQNQIVKLSAAALKAALVASDGVCVAMNSTYEAFNKAGEQHVVAAQPYVDGKPLDDFYREIWMTPEQNYALRGVLDKFTTAAREDLSDLNLREPAKKC